MILIKKISVFYTQHTKHKTNTPRNREGTHTPTHTHIKQEDTKRRYTVWWCTTYTSPNHAFDIAVAPASPSNNNWIATVHRKYSHSEQPITTTLGVDVDRTQPNDIDCPMELYQQWCRWVFDFVESITQRPSEHCFVISGQKSTKRRFARRSHNTTQVHLGLLFVRLCVVLCFYWPHQLCI